MFSRIFLAATLSALTLTPALAADRPASKVTVVFDKPLPNVPGKSMRGVIVDYAPGASSPAHRHPKSAFIYATVLEGEVRSSVNGEPAKVYKPGENWYEAPGAFHGVSANASDSKPARLMAVFVLDSDETVLVTPSDK
ncbi:MULTISPECIES: cupin domain-containing protein [unclassified Pseudomonas]|uniref:cupin domain-containing protein n=1 Tax=unclassified Pseudomonas TaxID=196821 RepID=UPI00244B6374|nr:MULTISPECIES: cupin domain-containing protein [unclassified Pseudomonas]MDH0301783.1 cupin domain-containing protein [Pseudomonas sp. GD04091]MDH1983929.1 cupin domain-containing protein [Pseudomonas sp. GD03689]